VITLSGGPKASASVGRNRLYVRMCRGIAAAGAWAVRFDYHGTGESTGVVDKDVSLGTPFVGDVRAVYEWLEAQGIHKYVFVGTCFGSRAALASAAKAPGLVGLALIAPPLRDLRKEESNANRLDTQLTNRQWLKRAMRPAVVKGLRDPRRREAYRRLVQVKVRSLRQRIAGGSGRLQPPWLSPKLLGAIEGVVERQLPLLFIYGDAEPLYNQFQQARAGSLGPILDAAGDRLSVVMVPRQVHGFTTIEVQDRTIEAIVDWVATNFCALEAR
jgi:pimeloyl-ACP methyl ester carboxylesterase